jgi:hypothetical protein
MPFSENSTIREILANEKAKAVLDKHIPGASTHPQIHMGMGMTLKQISWYPESGLTKEKLQALVQDLEQVEE